MSVPEALRADLLALGFRVEGDDDDIFLWRADPCGCGCGDWPECDGPALMGADVACLQRLRALLQDPILSTCKAIEVAAWAGQQWSDDD